MGIDVDLLFHPVGQGMFASGHLKRTNSNDTEFSWIYDCGSASAGQLEIGAVNRLAAHLGGPKPRIDLLVISHFDHDHISGIPHLLSRSEEHTSELQSLMRISYAVFCLKKK